ncbi:hypothetical protein ACVPOR_01940 [Staphylococcus aureus]
MDENDWDGWKRTYRTYR